MEEKLRRLEEELKTKKDYNKKLNDELGRIQEKGGVSIEGSQIVGGEDMEGLLE